MAPSAQAGLSGPVGGAFYGPGRDSCRPSEWLRLGERALESQLHKCIGRVDERGFCLKAAEIFSDVALAQREAILKGALEALRKEREENGRVPEELLGKVKALIKGDPWLAHRVLLGEIGKLREERDGAFKLFTELKDFALASKDSGC